MFNYYSYLIMLFKFIVFIVLFFDSFIYSETAKFRYVGWYNGDYNDINHIPFGIYTDIVTGFPYVDSNYITSCDKSDKITEKIVEIAHSKNINVIWRISKLPSFDILLNKSHSWKVDNFISNLSVAMDDCGIDGIEFDYEWADCFLGKIGVIPYEYSRAYSDFLGKVKQTIGNKTVSADIGIWGIPQNYPLGILPWVDSESLNSGTFDYVNIMSYSWNRIGSILPWIKDLFVIKNLWKFNLKRVNLGIPYFSMNYTHDYTIYNEPTWDSLSKLCPDIDPKENVCENITFIGKNMNYNIGKFAKSSGFGGLFPWTLNYDDIHNMNNSLIVHLNRGVQKGHFEECH